MGSCKEQGVKFHRSLFIFSFIFSIFDVLALFRNGDLEAVQATASDGVDFLLHPFSKSFLSLDEAARERGCQRISGHPDAESMLPGRRVKISSLPDTFIYFYL